jgi:hypothetical protein
MADLTLAAEIASKAFDDRLDRGATLRDLGRSADRQPIVSAIVTPNASLLAMELAILGPRDRHSMGNLSLTAPSSAPP